MFRDIAFIFHTVRSESTLHTQWPANAYSVVVFSKIDSEESDLTWWMSRLSPCYSYHMNQFSVYSMLQSNKLIL